MKKTMRTCAVAVGLTAMLVAGSGAAYAHHLKVSVNGSTAVGDVAYTATDYSSGISFNTNYGVEMDCATAAITGAGSIIKRGVTVAVPNKVGAIGNLAFSSCTMAGFGLNVTMTGGDINVRTHPATAGAPVPVTITGVSASIAATSGGTCTFNAAGTLNGEIRTQAGTDAVLELVPASFGPPVAGFGLTISNVVGCGGEVQNGDLAGAWYTDSAETLKSIFEINTTGAVTTS